MKVIIVGGVAGGATAAARIRRLDEHAEITVYERSGYISYANCGLPYYIGDVITDPEALTLQTPESFFKRFRINMKIHHEVISIHPECKTVSVKNLENGEIFEENYDKLILSPGGGFIGLELGIKESIVVNDRMETSVPDIYAAGDAVQVKHYVTGNDALISLAGPANKQGRIIADNICGGDSRYLGSQGSSVIKVFDMTAATTGINETNAKKSGLEVDTVILSPMSHAGYYPGGKVMTMKVVFEKESYRLLGAQIIGYEGVDKRIDVLATAIHAGLNATQLKDLDLAYASPYSSAKDPVNMAGFMIDNIAKGTLKQWHLEDMDKISRDKDVVLLDVRTVGEFSMGHIDGFKNIPVDELREQISEIEKGKPVYLICQSGLRSYIASRILEGNGYETYNFSGGFRFYDAVVNDRALIERAYACGMDY